MNPVQGRQKSLAWSGPCWRNQYENWLVVLHIFEHCLFFIQFGINNDIYIYITGLKPPIRKWLNMTCLHSWFGVGLDPRFGTRGLFGDGGEANPKKGSSCGRRIQASWMHSNTESKRASGSVWWCLVMSCDNVSQFLVCFSVLVWGYTTHRRPASSIAMDKEAQKMIWELMTTEEFNSMARHRLSMFIHSFKWLISKCCSRLEQPYSWQQSLGTSSLAVRLWDSTPH